VVECVGPTNELIQADPCHARVGTGATSACRTESSQRLKSCSIQNHLHGGPAPCAAPTLCRASRPGGEWEIKPGKVFDLTLTPRSGCGVTVRWTSARDEDACCDRKSMRTINDQMVARCLAQNRLRSMTGTSRRSVRRSNLRHPDWIGPRRPRRSLRSRRPTGRTLVGTRRERQKVGTDPAAGMTKESFRAARRADQTDCIDDAFRAKLPLAVVLSR